MKLDLDDSEGVLLLAEYVEALRCACIFESEEARARPAMAWGIIPLGLPDAETVAMLDRHEVEHDVPNRFYLDHLALLTRRRDLALLRWRRHNLPHKEGMHVH